MVSSLLQRLVCALHFAARWPQHSLCLWRAGAAQAAHLRTTQTRRWRRPRSWRGPRGRARSCRAPHTGCCRGNLSRCCCGGCRRLPRMHAHVIRQTPPSHSQVSFSIVGQRGLQITQPPHSEEHYQMMQIALYIMLYVHHCTQRAAGKATSLTPA